MSDGGDEQGLQGGLRSNEGPEEVRDLGKICLGVGTWAVGLPYSPCCTSVSACCISHSIKTLLSDFGVNPAVYELDEMQRGREIEQALLRLGCSPSVPAVFIGGEFVGGANDVMSLHLKRSLIPVLKRVGALWV
ncbi:hypothetical protein ACLB2K_037412 [Fragaria x ananassa]